METPIPERVVIKESYAVTAASDTFVLKLWIRSIKEGFCFLGTKACTGFSSFVGKKKKWSF